jgi:TP901-1 family phage major tail protein
MSRLNLQLFDDPVTEPAAAETAQTATTVKGKRIIYLFRLLKDAASKAGVNIAYTTENSNNMSRDSDSTETKDGPITTPGTLETTISATAILSVGGESMTYDDIRDAMIDDEMFEIWEVNLDNPSSTTGKYKGLYMRGKCTSCELSSPADDNAEADLEWAVNGIPQKGDVTVSGAAVAASAYAFADAIPSA